MKAKKWVCVFAYYFLITEFSWTFWLNKNEYYSGRTWRPQSQKSKMRVKQFITLRRKLYMECRDWELTITYLPTWQHVRPNALRIGNVRTVLTLVLVNDIPRTLSPNSTACVRTLSRAYLPPPPNSCETRKFRVALHNECANAFTATNFNVICIILQFAGWIIQYGGRGTMFIRLYRDLHTYL